MSTLRTILAIETSCDETSAAVIARNGRIARIRSNIVASQIALHAKTGGVVPEVAAREHVKPIMLTIDRALTEARMTLARIDAIAVTVGPGLHTALSVGVETAKALALATSKPLYPINHLRGHIAANWNGRAPRLPALALIVSGGHTELVLVRSLARITLLGATRDDAAGECFDKIAQLLGLGYPGGPVISAVARHGNPDAYDLPRPMRGTHGHEFSFAGLKTSVRYLVDREPGIRRSNKKLADLCASVQRAITDILIEKTMCAAQQHKPREILLAGGVAANVELRTRLRAASRRLPWKPTYHQPPFSLCTDNAGMIGLAAAYFPQQQKTAAWKTVDIMPTLSL